MLFTLDLDIELKSYRLSSNNSWRSIISGEKIKPDDKNFSEFEACIKYLKSFKSKDYIEINNKKYRLRKETNIANPFKIPDLYPLAHRTELPHIFTREELEKVIVSGDDDIINVLTIDLEGYLRLHNQDIINDSMNYNVPIAVRNEAFTAGNDCVGLKTVNDNNFIKETRLTLLGGLYTHLSTGRLDRFTDVVPSESEEELLDNISKLYK